MHISIALFNRDSKNLIDFIKSTEEDPFMATNIRSLNTKGFESSVDYNFAVSDFNQKINLSYTFIEDKIKDFNLSYSRYAINSLNHQLIGNFRTQFFKNLSQTILYKYAVRTAGDDYSVVDISANYQLKNCEIWLKVNNIFNEEYTETNLVPMSKGNLLFGLTYTFK